MKYIKFILLFAFIFSCSNESEDSDNTENNSALIGTWRSVWTGECLSNDCQLHMCNDEEFIQYCDYDDDCNSWELTFNSNGSVFMYAEDNCIVETRNFEWTITTGDFVDNNSTVIDVTGQWLGENGEDVFGTNRYPILVLNDNSMDLIIEMSQSEGYIARTSWNKVN